LLARNENGPRLENVARASWWAILGSNQWPLPCEGSALPLS
jgi:hypothetical protein